MSEIKILDTKIKASELRAFAENWYVDFLKGTVDLENRKVAIGGDYHIESAEILIQNGGKNVNIWGFNLRYFEDNTIIEFDSLVNIKPHINNSRLVQSENLREEIEKLVREFIEF